MFSRRQFTLTTSGLTAVTSLGLAASLSACSKSGSADAAGTDDMWMGSETAKVTLVEYASVTCGHCAHFNETVFPELNAKYIKPGKIKYVYREFLTPPAAVSAAGILVARCSGKENYFKVVDQIMRSQKEMFSSADPNAPRTVLLRIAKQAGLSDEQFEQCVTDKDGLKRIEANVRLYQSRDNIDGTPAFQINGKKFIYKGGGIAEFDAALKPLLGA